ncbi:MAG: aminotransferase class III-fold pyridoxal phosphate-dependent enzyme, partial [Firmicutes bacterium]|nr:aminotransferase class III-fold pyridoxal phosphate-dependent enzyme [Bacillota bacterium]
IVTLAKGIASSYMPLSATVTRQTIFEQFLHDPGDKLKYFRDISTYGGNAAACAAAMENIRIIEDENLLEHVTGMGEYLVGSLKELESHPMVGEVRGKGLFAGVELVVDKNTKEPAGEQVMGKILADAAGQGVLLGKMNRSVPGRNNVITMAPAYIITKDEIDRIVSALRTALERI